MRVLISGAGIAGPALAWFLAKANARVTVVEKSSALLAQGQNIDVEGSAVTVARKMGILDRIRKLSTGEVGTQLIDSRGHPCAQFPVKEGYVSPTSQQEILRGDLATILFELTKDHPNVDYLFNTTIKRILSNDERAVRVELSNGETPEFDVLVAADGQWSKVRQMCFPPEAVTVKSLQMYVAYFTVPRTIKDNDWWNVFVALGSRVVMTRPDPYGTIRANLSHMPADEQQKRLWHETARSDRKTQQELVKRQFAGAGWETQRLLDAMDGSPEFYFQALEQIQMRKWSHGRVVCAGDCAHAPTPVTGGGTRLALTGAYILAGELANLADGEHPSRAFDGYNNAFHGHVEKVQEIPFFVPAFMHPGTEWKRWLLQTLFFLLAKIVASPILAGKAASGESQDDGFPLPTYSRLDDAISKDALDG